MVCVVLQNMYFRDGKARSYSRFVAALKQNRSGKMLRNLIKGPWKGSDVRFMNTTPKIGTHPDSKLPPDLPYLKRNLKRYAPSLVVACGQQAEEACLSCYKGSMLVVPHPAYRVLTKDLYLEASRDVEHLQQLSRVLTYSICVKWTQGRGVINRTFTRREFIQFP